MLNKGGAQSYVLQLFKCHQITRKVLDLQWLLLLTLHASNTFSRLTELSHHS